ncbi:MAG: 23S rRNA (guanosine(2251)-2'-O)-methyltransferase RlmB [Alkaliphilus sp.]|nr:23S rRNA (guanosine(2251)-2'-O)-methyltransferase RlmB [Alkaliphilus sp.]
MEHSDKIEGRNPVMEALRSDREIDKILIANGVQQGSIQKIIGMAKDKGILIQYVEKQKIDQLSESHSHQGVLAYVAAYEYADVEDIIKKAEEKGEDPFIIILDEITDPHNLGSVIRTANAAGAHGIIIPKRRSVGLTAVVAKTSAGALEYVPVAKVSNISQTIDNLKARGIWVVGADMEGEQTYYKADLTGKIALVIGSEGLGIGRLIKEKCDFLINIPMKGEVGSLNASIAASIIIYEVMKQRQS